MYRIRHLLLLLTVLFAGYNVQAQTQSPYKYDFNSPIDTSDPEFAPLGWGHIVDAMVVRSNTYYVQYAYQATGGVDDSGCLHIGSQTVTDSLTQTQTLNDILVLPPVGGSVTVDVKALNYGSDIKFYYVNFEDGKFTTDGLIDMLGSRALRGPLLHHHRAGDGRGHLHRYPWQQRPDRQCDGHDG